MTNSDNSAPQDSANITPTAPETAAVAAEPVAPAAAAPAADAAPATTGDQKPGAGPLAARGLGVAKPASPGVTAASLEAATTSSNADTKKPPRKSKGTKYPRPRLAGEKEDDQAAGNRAKAVQTKIAVPSLRSGLSDDLQAELDAELAAADFDTVMGGNAGMADRKGSIEEGTRIQAQVLKIHGDSVFFALGGPDEGALPLVQFTEEEPTPGQTIEVVVRGFSSEDGLYNLTIPGKAVDVSDWEDIDEGSVVEATVTGHNAGGLECKVGNMDAFMPISQVTEYRVEDLSEFVDQKMVCIVTESNERRGNLVVSRRAVLERERAEKREAQLQELEAGDVLEGTVRSIKDFGAFVDLGGLDGLIHISKLSWERVKHPSDVMEEGQKVKVRIDTIDKDTGKIGLSYRDLLENPWDTAEEAFAVGTNHQGTVTRTAPFGCFVRLTAGVEGLVHISELAHHRVSKVESVVNEGDEVEVKVLSFDRDSQKVGLSIKGAAPAPVDPNAKPAAEEVDEPPREPVVKATHTGPLRGGNDTASGGEQFGLRW